jgi:hypothetical protein
VLAARPTDEALAATAEAHAAQTGGPVAGRRLEEVR